MKALIFIFLFFSTSAFGVIHSLSPTSFFTIDVPSSWTVSYTGEELFLETPSGSIWGNIAPLPPSEGNIYAKNYDGLNALLQVSLNLIDINFIKNRGGTGIYFKEMTEPTYQYYRATGDEYYVGESAKTMYFYYPTAGAGYTFTYNVYGYFFSDGLNAFIGQVIVTPSATISELNQFLAMMYTVDSLYYQSR